MEPNNWLLILVAVLVAANLGMELYMHGRRKTYIEALKMIADRMKGGGDE